MSGSALDVEALLDSVASSTGDQSAKSSRRPESRDKPPQNGHGDGSPGSDRRSRDHSRDRRRSRHGDGDGDTFMIDLKGDAHDSRRNRRRSRSRDDDRYRRRDRRDDRGDYYRGGGHPRDRSRSPRRPRGYYRPPGQRRDDDRRHEDRHRDRGDRGERGDHGEPRRRTKTPEPQLTEDERDRRTIFVQQLAARLRTKQLTAFFEERAGPVKEAQIVKDRISNRSKGVGYVEFKDEDSVAKAIQLTGQKLMEIPIIVQHTEAEKNRQARNTESSGTSNSVPFHRLYVGNIHFSITEDDLQNIFEPFGELEFVQLQKEDQGRSKGYGFVQFRDPIQAKEALEKMNGFELAGRPIRVGLGNDRFTNESTQNLLQRFPNQAAANNFQGSAFSGSGGKGVHAGGANMFDRAGGRETERSGGNASALDDADVAGVNFSNYSRDALMRKLARTDEPASDSRAQQSQAAKRAANSTPSFPVPQMASRCVCLKNMFNPNEEEGNAWIKELEDDVRTECQEKYGHVVHIAVDPNTDGDIFVKFDRVQGGENAMKGLNGRFFGGRQISANPVSDAIYKSLYPKSG